MSTDESSGDSELENNEVGLARLDAVQKALTWAYDTALSGLPGLGSVDELAESYKSKNASVENSIDSLIDWQIGKAGLAGFITGLGGVITLPVSIPANIATVSLIQLRMIAAIAILRGYDVRSDQVKTLCYACLAGSAVGDVLKDVGIKLGTKLGQQAIGGIAGSTLVRINQAVGFRLVTKAGSTGIFNLTKIVPFLGGIIGGTYDAMTSRIIADAAKSVFVADSGSDALGNDNGAAKRARPNPPSPDAPGAAVIVAENTAANI